MKTLFFLILFPALAHAGPYYEVINSTTAGTSTMTISGYIGVAASSTTPTTYKFRIDGPAGYLQFPDNTKQTTAFNLNSTQTFTGQNTFINLVTISSQVMITGGGPGQGKALISDTYGLGSWQQLASSGYGDNLGSHIATHTLNMSNFGIVNIDTITTVNGIFISTGDVVFAPVDETLPYADLWNNQSIVWRVPTYPTPNQYFNQGGTCTAIQNYSEDYGATTALLFKVSTYAAVGYSPAMEQMRIAKTGRVGIGVTIPAEKLDIAGNLKLSGQITANGQGNQYIYGKLHLANLSVSATSYFGDDIVANNDITSQTGDISAPTGDITANYFYGDGINLTGIPQGYAGAPTNYWYNGNDFHGVVAFANSTYPIYTQDIQMQSSSPTIIGFGSNLGVRNILFPYGLQINSTYDYAYNWIKADTNTLNAKYYDGSIGAWLNFDKYGLVISSGLRAGASRVDGSGGVGIINSAGKIPALSTTYFASVDGSNLTGISDSTKLPLAGGSMTGQLTVNNATVTLVNDSLVYALTLKGATKQTLKFDDTSASAGTHILGEVDFNQDGNGKFRILAHGDTHATYPEELILAPMAGVNKKIRLTGNQNYNPDLFVSSFSSVGINTANPNSLYKLDVNGSARIAGAAFSVGTSTFVVTGGKVGIGTTSPGTTLDVLGVIWSNAARPIIINGSAGRITIQGESGGWANYLHFLGSGGTDRGGFGALGGTDALTYLYAGGSYSNPTMVWSDGKVGIGTTSPGYTLDIQRSVAGNYMGLIKNTETTGYSSVYYANNTAAKGVSVGIGNPTSAVFANAAFIDTTGSSPLIFAINDTEKMRLDSSGNVNIGTPVSPDHLLELTAGAAYSEIAAGEAQFTTGSSKKIKANIQYLTPDSEKFAQLKPAKFNFKIDKSSDVFHPVPYQVISTTTTYGMIAEDVKAIYPEMEDGKIDWNFIQAQMINTVIELQKRVNVLEGKP